MKNLIISSLFILLTCSVMGQEKFSVPEVQIADKHQQVIFQFWGIFGGSVQFAKNQGVSPYEFGQYLGGLFAPGWNEEAGFEGFVNATVYIWECFNTKEDGSVSVEEKEDGSVLIRVPIESRKKYFTGNQTFLSFEDVHLCMLAIMEQVAEHMSATFSQEITEDAVIYLVNRK